MIFYDLDKNKALKNSISIISLRGSCWKLLIQSWQNNIQDNITSYKINSDNRLDGIL